MLWIPRVILFVPRWAVWAIGQPVRGGAWAYEHYDLPGVFRHLFFSADEVWGIYPVVSYETGFGASGGLRLVHRDLFGGHERLFVRASWGGRFRQAYGMMVSTGDRLPGVVVSVDGAYERRPQEPFYGIGNDSDHEVRFPETLWRGIATVDVTLGGPFHLRVADAVVHRDLLRTTVDNNRIEAAVLYDTTRRPSPYGIPTLDTSGWLAIVHGGYARGFDGDATNFWSYGAEIQRFVDLYRGTRLLGLRLILEGITGDASFTDLPQLGGAEFLRGYRRGRFRDDVVGLATAEYTWDLGNYFAGYLFADVGRVWDAFDEITLDDLRAGFGLGVQWHTLYTYLARAQVAVSKDGDVLFDLIVTPAFSRRERLGRF